MFRPNDHDLYSLINNFFILVHLLNIYTLTKTHFTYMLCSIFQTEYIITNPEILFAQSTLVNFTFAVIALENFCFINIGFHFGSPFGVFLP